MLSVSIASESRGRFKDAEAPFPSTLSSISSNRLARNGKRSEDIKQRIDGTGILSVVIITIKLNFIQVDFNIRADVTEIVGFFVYVIFRVAVVGYIVRRNLVCTE